MSAQSLQALSLANETRARQTQVRREIREQGPAHVAELLRDPDEIVGSIRLERLLGAMDRYGAVRCRRLLRRAGLHPGRLGRRVRELSERERRVLAEAVER